MLFEHSIRCVIITMFISAQYKAITDAAYDDIGALLREAVGRGSNTYAQSEANESGEPAHSVRRRRYYDTCPRTSCSERNNGICKMTCSEDEIEEPDSAYKCSGEDGGGGDGGYDGYGDDGYGGGGGGGGGGDNGCKCCIPGNDGVCTVNCNHGSCNENTKRCVCDPGWGGEYCTKKLCTVNCNHGSCNENTNRCVCNSGWGGEYCTKKLCTVNCNHGSCNENTKRCVCHRGWGGEYCTKKVCTVNCNHGSCNENTNRCVCNPGWEGEYCTKKSNGCSKENSQCGKPGNYGFCRSEGCLSDEKVCRYSKNDCPGKDCQCCKPKKESNGCIKENSQCGNPGNYGFCRSEGCLSDEKVCRYSKYDCPGKDCQCCKPKKESNGCSRENSRCGKQGNYGFCRSEGCRSNEKVCRYSKTDCPGKDCQCCKPKKGISLHCKSKCPKKTAGRNMKYCTGRPPMVQQICLNPGETQTIRSPNYPNRYCSKTWCKWRVKSCKDITITCSEAVLQSSNGKCAKKQYLRHCGRNSKSCVGDKNILIVLKGHRKRIFKGFTCTLRAAN